jgi:hypothetical protein
MIVDAHTHYGDWYFPIKNPTAEETQGGMKKLGIDHAVFSSSSAIVYDFREGNAELAGVLKKVPEFSGYVSVNCNYLPESLREIETYLSHKEESGFIGIKVHPLLAGRSFDCDECLHISEAAAKYEAPILIHTFGSASSHAAMISWISAGWSSSGRHISEMMVKPSTSMPTCSATMSSGTVDIPTMSAPIIRRYRYSAAVSSEGPCMAA